MIAIIALILQRSDPGECADWVKQSREALGGLLPEFWALDNHTPAEACALGFLAASLWHKFVQEVQTVHAQVMEGAGSDDPPPPEVVQ